MSESPWLDPGFSTMAMTEIFSAEATVAAVLEFEAALALGLADAGMAPVDQARAAADACALGIDDPEGALAGAWESGTPLLAIRAAVADRIGDDEVSRWVHHGATTQDAMDTARMLQSRRALERLESSLAAAASLLEVLVVEHRRLPQMGRTFLQDARPTTFGFRAARWLWAILEHFEDLQGVRRRLPVQLGGPAGLPLAYGPAAVDVMSSLARRLGLERPAVSWHVDRAPVRSLGAAVESAVLTASQIAEDLVLLAQTTVSEVAMRPGGSSSMPEKRNPIDAVRVVAAARVCVGAASVLRLPSGHQLDRGIGGWHAEWAALPLTFHTAGAALEALVACLDGLEVDPAAMADRVGPDRGESLAGADPRLIDHVLERYHRVVGPG